MGRLEKRVAKMRRNQRGVRFQEMDALLTALGFEKRTLGSHNHYTLKTDDGSYPITIPFKRPHIGRIYVKQILALIDELDLLNDDTENEDDR